MEFKGLNHKEITQIRAIIVNHYNWINIGELAVIYKHSVYAIIITKQEDATEGKE